MKKFNFSKLFFAAALVASLVMLSACKPADDETKEKTTGVDGVVFIKEDDGLVGKWVDSNSSVYEITKEIFKNYGETYASYEGKELCVKKDNDTAGVIYIKYTKSYEETTEDKSGDSTWTAKWGGTGYYRYSETAPDVGKWYAVAYKDLSANGIFISGAWGSKDGHKKTSTETLKEAVEEFTLENGYFDFTYGECTKKKN